jgi:hypothetical protein
VAVVHVAEQRQRWQALPTHLIFSYGSLRLSDPGWQYDVLHGLLQMNISECTGRSVVHFQATQQYEGDSHREPQAAHAAGRCEVSVQEGKCAAPEAEAGFLLVFARPSRHRSPKFNVVPTMSRMI